MTQGEFFGYVIDVLERLEIPYMVTGSVASIAYSKARLTLDMDIIVDLSPEQAKELEGNFISPDYHANLDSMLEAIRNRSHFNIIHVPSGSKVDFYLVKRDTFSQEEFTRRQRFAFDDKRDATFARPEDIILSKLDFYKEGGSEKHLGDIRQMLIIIGNALDISYIEFWSKQKNSYDIWLKLKTER